MPRSCFGVRKQASRLEFHYRTRSSGKGIEYHLSSFPVEVQEAVLATIQADAGTETSPVTPPITDRKEEASVRWSRLTDPEKKARAKARRWVVKSIDEICGQESLPLSRVIADFERRLFVGEPACPPDLRKHLPIRHGVVSLSISTLYRWHRDYSALGIAGLIDDYGNRSGKSVVSDHPDLMKAVLGCLFQRPHITPIGVQAYLRATEPSLSAVKETTLRRFMRQWKAQNAQLWTLVTHPDRWKNVYMVAFGSQSESVTALNGLWEMDATPADWMLKDGRHAVIVTIDLYSRRMRALVSKTSKASAVGLAFRRAVSLWGVPRKLRTDNGKEFVGQLFADALDGLDIGHLICIPFASEQKGHVERAIQTLLHGVLELLEGFIGHSVADRKVIEARKSFARRVMTEGEVIEVELTAAQLQDTLDRWCDDLYQHNAHSGLGGKTPFEVAAAWRAPVRRLEHEGALDMLLLDAERVRTVGKKGIQYDGRLYIDNALVEHVGREVRVRFDPSDLGRILVLSGCGEFICWAQNPEMAGISRREMAIAAKHYQAELASEQRKEARAYAKSISKDMVGPILDAARDRNKSLVALTQKSVEYTTPALDEHRKAFEALESVDPAPLNEAQEASMRVFEVDFGKKRSRPSVDELRGDAEKYAHWELLDEALRAGSPLGDDELRFHASYQRSSYWRITREIEGQLRQAG